MMQTCLPVPHKFHPKCVQSSGIDWNSRLFKPASEVWGFGMGLPSVLHSAWRGLLRVTRMPMAVPAFPRLPHLGQEWVRGLVTGLYRNPYPVTGAPKEVLVGRMVFSSHSLFSYHLCRKDLGQTREQLPGVLFTCALNNLTSILFI